MCYLKVLLYSEGKNLFSKSGVGRALKHQIDALIHNGVDFTTDENEEYDVAHINTIGTGAAKIIKRCRKKGIPVVYNTHTTYEDFRDSFLFSNLAAPFIKRRIKRLYGSADYLISPSIYTKSSFDILLFHLLIISESISSTDENGRLSYLIIFL